MKIYSATIRLDTLEVGSRETYYARQKRIFILAVMLVAVVPLSLIGWVSAHYYQKSWLQKSALELTSLAANRQEVIDRFLIDQENLLAALVGITPTAELANQENLERIFAVLRRGGVIIDLGVIDREGNHLAYAGPYRRLLAERNYRQAPWFAATLAQGRHVSDVFRGFRDEPHLVVAVADEARQVVLRATLDSELFNALLAATEVGPGGDAFIINRRGELQTPARCSDSVALVALVAGEAASFQAGPTEVVGGRQRQVVQAVVSLKRGEWLLVLQKDVAQSLAGFYRARNLGTAAVAFLALAVMATAALVVQTMLRRLEKADRERMQLNNRVREVEKMALMGRLATSVAHEINNPLQIIGDQAGWIEELLTEEEPAQVRHLEEYREAAAKIKQHVGRASTITRRLLGLSQPMAARRVEIDLNQLVRDTVSFLEHEVRKQRIRLALELAVELPKVVSRPGQLQQVLLNLLNNAIDAAGREGTVIISTSRRQDRVAVAVADSGPGLPPELMAKIFDPFFTTKQPGKGTGLGLSISRNIMERLGGDLQAANRPEGGGVFTLTLPAA